MPFNKIIMNPPYSGNLHLKILREAMKHIEKEGGEIVNLSPIRWLQDPLAEYKRNSGGGDKGLDFEFIRRHIESIEIIDSISASNIFGSSQAADLGIYYVTKNGGFDFSVFENKLVKKIMDKANDKIISHLEKSGGDYCVKIPHVFGRPNTSGEELYISPNKEISMNKENKNGGERTRWLNFKTYEEANNCFDSFFTNFWKWLVKSTKVSCNVNKVLPYLGDYSHPWTDADLFAYFNLTPEERKIIEEEMKWLTK